MLILLSNLVQEFYATKKRVQVRNYRKRIKLRNYENNVPSRLSPQWLCENSCSWTRDAWLHIATTNEPISAQQANQSVIKVVISDPR